MLIIEMALFFYPKINQKQIYQFASKFKELKTDMRKRKNEEIYGRIKKSN